MYQPTWKNPSITFTDGVPTSENWTLDMIDDSGVLPAVCGMQMTFKSVDGDIDEQKANAVTAWVAAQEHSDE